MFGYIVPKECELRVREQAVYRSVYCGLCKSMEQHYGKVSTLCLQYDCTFLALLLNALSGDSAQAEKCHCLHHCQDRNRRYRLDNPSLHFAAGVNVILGYYKCLDAKEDKESLKEQAGALLFATAHKKAAREFPQVEQAARAYVLSQRAAEEKGAGADEAAHPTGEFLKALADLAPGIPEKARVPLRWMFYHLGRWIYFMDAWDDREKDRASGAFNPFLTASREDAAFALSTAMKQCQDALLLLPLQRDAGLIENIVTLGCPHKAMEILGQAHKEERDESL